jgi:hypothetical protein
MAGVRRLSSDRFGTDLETIESAYEFMLAYAAQGRETDAGAAISPSIRATLQGLYEALAGVARHFAEACADDAAVNLAQTIDDDAAKALVSVAAALSCARISSQLVDNLNASIHLRAVLTDLFLADEILRIAAAPPA